jgi:outer membrane protein
MTFGAESAKIGLVDFQKILSTSSAGKSAQTEITKQGKQMEEDLKKRGDEIEESQKKLEREAAVMSKEKREEKERDLRIKISDFNALKKKYTEDFKGLEKRLIAKIQSEVIGIIEEIGKKEGYVLILEKREGGILYFPSTIDITDRLIQQYNETLGKSQKPAAKEKSETGKPASIKPTTP